LLYHLLCQTSFDRCAASCPDGQRRCRGSLKDPPETALTRLALRAHLAARNRLQRRGERTQEGPSCSARQRCFCSYGCAVSRAERQPPSCTSHLAPFT
ncbi:MAG: hypothetical protein J2P36_13375, partial [Ktedonobacteraceae bacterium]|nr:hypothetical protein [Ktedonobacteraceae bacterium]